MNGRLIERLFPQLKPRFLLGLGFLVFMIYRLGSEDRRYKEERIKQSAFGNNKGGWLGLVGSGWVAVFCLFLFGLLTGNTLFKEKDTNFRLI